MVSVALKISEEFKALIEKLPWVNWSELAREELIKQEKRLKAWEEVEKIVSKSKLTQEQADNVSDEINLSLAKRYQALLKRRK